MDTESVKLYSKHSCRFRCPSAAVVLTLLLPLPLTLPPCRPSPAAAAAGSQALPMHRCDQPCAGRTVPSERKIETRRRMRSRQWFDVQQVPRPRLLLEPCRGTWAYGVAEEGCYRAPLPLPPTNTSIHLLQVATGAVYFLGYFRDTIIHWSTLPLPSSLRSIWVYGRVGLSPDRGSFRGDQIGTYRDAGGGSTEPTGRYIAARPILQLCEEGGRRSGSTRRRFWWEWVERRVEQ